MVGLIIFVLFLAPFFIKKVPNNTVIIIDRNTHYLKTKKRGVYFFNPFIDEITTEISTKASHKTLTETFETEDGFSFPITINCSYFSNNIDNTLELLKSSRRSINDIILSSIYSAVGSLKAIDIQELLTTQAIENMKKELGSFSVSLKTAALHFTVAYATRDNTTNCFKPHISHSRSKNFAITYERDSFDGPIQYK